MLKKASQAIKALSLFCIASVSLLLPTHIQAQAQTIPSLHNDDSASAFIIKPSQGMTGTPSGWTKVTTDTYGNSALDHESYYPSGGASAATITTDSYTLPYRAYEISVCVRGKGKARIEGTTTWVEFDANAGIYEWVNIGTTASTMHFSVEVAYSGSTTMYYAGVCAEGPSLDINPVSAVWQKIQNGERVVIAVLGDSVTENARGDGGGSTSFETGNPGLLKAFLETASGEQVDYITHREPPTWPATGDNIADVAGIPTATYNGGTYLDARQELDEGKQIHLINFGRGGADASYAWSRFRDTIIDTGLPQAFYDDATLMSTHGTRESVRYGLEHYQPDLVIFNFGTNDNNSDHTAWTVDDFLFHAKATATNLQQRFGAAVILSTPHKWSEGTHLANHWEPELVAKLRDYTTNSGFALSDVFLAYQIDQDDAIHPRDIGHAHIANSYIKAIKGEAQLPASSSTLTASDFTTADCTVTNTINGLMMLMDPNAFGEVQNETEAIALLAQINADNVQGYNDWRFPTPEEIFPLIDQSNRPAIVDGIPLLNLSGYYYHGPIYNWQGTPSTSGFDFTIGVIHSLGTAGSPKIGHIFPVRNDVPTTPVPVFSPNGGTVTTGTLLRITAPLGIIYYTTDGSDPRMGDDSVNPAALTIASGNTIAINANVTVKARALNNSLWSGPNEASFVIDDTPATPTFSPNGGAVMTGTQLTITGNSGTLYYTTDGTDPRMGDDSVNPNATQIASGSSITINADVTVKARSLNSGIWSTLKDASFVIDDTPPNPTLSPNGGTVTTGTLVTITGSAGTLYYTLDGSDPRMGDGSIDPNAIEITSGSTIAIMQDATLKVRAISNADWSDLVEATFVIDDTPPAPTLSPNGGTITTDTPVSLIGSIGTLYYTIDGSDPKMGDDSVNPTAILITSGATFQLTEDVTVKARALNSGLWSDLTQATFIVEEIPVGLWGEDNFEDGDYTNIDTSLTKGMNWELISGGSAIVYARDTLPDSQRLRLKGNTTLLLVKGSKDTPAQNSLGAPFEAEFDVAQEWYCQDKMGMVFLYQDSQNYYKLEVSDVEVAIHRVMGGVETTIGSSTDMGLAYNLNSAKITLQVNATASALTFDITKSEATTYNPVNVSPTPEAVTWSDNNASALATFTTGRIGFYQFDEPSIYNSPHYDNIKITSLADGDGGSTPTDLPWGEDDFEDGDYTDPDPALNNGLTWEMISGGTVQVTTASDLPTSQRLRLKGSNTLILVKGSANAPTQSILPAPFTVEFFDVPRWYAEDDMGLIFLYQDAQNYYKLEVTLTEVAVHRVMDGVETTIGSSIAMKMGTALNSAEFKLQVTETLTARTFTVTKSKATGYLASTGTPSDEVEIISWSDNNASALATFTEGRIGFYQFHEPSIYNSPHYDNIVITTQMLDLDDDGLDDDWEIDHFDNIAASDGSGNFDGDRLSDLQEYIAGTDPTDATSRLKAISISINPSTSVCDITWSSVEGKTYEVQFSTTLDTDDWTAITGLEAEAATPPTNSATFTPGFSGPEFYRILLK